jgi:pseudaminic acid cytidylyltransferase
MVIAIIPARGGSKRIPGKNMKPFLGKPLITYPLDYLTSSPNVSKVFVSTDSERIKNIALEYGPDVPFDRTSELSGDYVPTLDVIKDVIIGNGDLIAPETLVLCVYPAAILDIQTWSRFFRDLNMVKEEFLVTVGRSRNHPFRSIVRVLESENMLVMASPELSSTRTQDLPPSYYDAGKVYAAKARVWLSKESILGEEFRGFELPFWAAQDLDDLDDWELAESLAKSRM